MIKFFVSLCCWLCLAAVNTYASDFSSVAYMDDVQVREALLKLLSEKSQPVPANVQPEASEPNISELPADTWQIINNINFQLVWLNITEGQGWPAVSQLLYKAAWLVFLASAAQLFLNHCLMRMLLRIFTGPAAVTRTEQFVQLGQRLTVRLAGIGGFAVLSWLIVTWISDIDSAERMLLLAVLQFLLLLKLTRMVVMELLYLWPHRQRHYRSWGTAYMIFYGLSIFAVPALQNLGLSSNAARLAEILLALLINLTVNLFVWSHRQQISRLFTDTDRPQPLSLVARSWPVLASIWLLMIWWFWSRSVYLQDQDTAAKVALCWWLTVFFPIADRVFARFMQQVSQHPWLQSPVFHRRACHFRSNMQNGLRLLLGIFAGFSMLESSGYSTAAFIQLDWVQWLLHAMVQVLLICLLAYLSWTLIQSAIERRLPEPAEDSGAPEGEGGGAGASRTETLLPLLRSFMFSFILVSVVLSVLNALGVEIAPLLAGAGVLGIAIGFGSQKLVADIISGIFFLLDDAFRRGEYIEAAEMQGTVEAISIRSMRLRHHLGAVQTVPYSEIATVKNLSRDWITMKLELRLPYNTDSEKVRKIIKKLGLQMLDDPVIGEHFILPLKSQGVLRVEESALIFRMKFTCVPGEQWVIRREAYRRAIAALDEQGIRFAHRAVHVLVQDQPDSTNSVGSLGAAAEDAVRQSMKEQPSVPDGR